MRADRMGERKAILPGATRTQERYMTTTEPTLAVDSHFGIYGPQTFAERFSRENITEDDWNTLLDGPEAEYYWETWEHVAMSWNLEGLTILESDGDIWLVDTDAPLGTWEGLL